MSLERQPSCLDPTEHPGLLPVSEALMRIEASATAVAETEHVDLHGALRRVLAVDVYSPIQVPAYTNSAMDGFAIKAEDIPAEGTRRLTLVGDAFAGSPSAQVVGAGQAVKIMTGGKMPQGADTVVISEHAQADGDGILIDHRVEALRNVRQAGEDLNTGDLVLARGTRLGAAEIAMLASLGVADCEVYRRVKVAFFSTGDELVAVDAENPQLEEGQIYDSNRYALYGLLEALDVEMIDLGVVRDEAETTRKAFVQAAELADVIITSGGASVGEADYVSRTLHEMGDVAFWKLAIRPGRPLAFGRLGESLMFGLPGNPVAAMVTFTQFVRPALLKTMGCERLYPPRLQAICTDKLKKSAGRTEFQRGVLYRDEQNQLCVKTTGKQGAGRLSSMCIANCLMILPPEKNGIAAGEWVEVEPFEGLFS